VAERLAASQTGLSSMELEVGPTYGMQSRRLRIPELRNWVTALLRPDFQCDAHVEIYCLTSTAKEIKSQVLYSSSMRRPSVVKYYWHGVKSFVIQSSNRHLCAIQCKSTLLYSYSHG
jgi:hypothetical protein